MFCGFRSVRFVVSVGATVLPGASTEYLLTQAALSSWAVVQGASPARPDEVVSFLSAAGATALVAWLGLSTLAAALAHLPGRAGQLAERVTSACAPALSRRVAAVLVGATVTGALAPGTAVGAPSPVLNRAAEAAPGFRVTAAEATAPAPSDAAPPPPEPGWTPARPTVRPQPSPRLLAGAAAPAAGAATVVVHRGDTLWDIVRHHLGASATDAEVAEQWPAWHAANRAVIGADPGRILPGQVLHAPTHRTADAHR
jgi:nucleoid-associated protein YgaU